MLKECDSGKWILCVFDSWGTFLQAQLHSEPCAIKHFSITTTIKNTVITVIITAAIITRADLVKCKAQLNNLVSQDSAFL